MQKLLCTKQGQLPPEKVGSGEEQEGAELEWMATNRHLPEEDHFRQRRGTVTKPGQVAGPSAWEWGPGEDGFT